MTPAGGWLLLFALPVALGAFFLFYRLTDTGFTYDELTDFLIARDLLNTRDIFGNLEDPSQGRFAHVVAAIGMGLLGSDLLGFKLPFAGMGLTTADLRAWLVRARFGNVVAWLTGGFLILCSYSLAAFRTGATAGDGLVLPLWLLFTWTTAWWITQRGGFGRSAVVEIVLGLAVGAKLTSGVLAVVPLVRVLNLQRSGLAQQGRQLVLQLIVIYAVAGCAAVAANPLFLLGPRFLAEVVQEGRRWDSVPEIMVFGQWFTHPPLTYLPAVFLSKLTAPLLLAAGLGRSRLSGK